MLRRVTSWHVILQNVWNDKIQQCTVTMHRRICFSGSSCAFVPLAWTHPISRPLSWHWSEMSAVCWATAPETPISGTSDKLYRLSLGPGTNNRNRNHSMSIHKSLYARIKSIQILFRQRQPPTCPIAIYIYMAHSHRATLVDNKWFATDIYWS